MGKIIFILLMLVGCSEPQDMPSQTAPAQFSVKVVWEENQTELQQFARAYGQRAEIDGFAVMRSKRDGYECEIHVVRLTSLSENNQELLGHEFAHCLFGNYHQ